jgi:hypothetical protein
MRTQSNSKQLIEGRRLAMASDMTQVMDNAMIGLVSSSISGADRMKVLWVQYVKDCELWPVAACVRGRSVEEVLSVIEAIRGPVVTLKAGEPCGCREPTLEVVRAFQTSRNSVYGEKVGLCLDCVVSHGKLTEAGECRLDRCTSKVKDLKRANGT